MHHHKFTWVVLVVACVGCANPNKVEQLSEAAKGWCRTIRASQVLPVYPLQEDVRVGDLYVVQRPIEDEAELWERQGFLPLGNHLARLDCDDLYPRFYAHGAYGVAGQFPPPTIWQTIPSSGQGSTPTATRPTTTDYSRPESTSWSTAPRASFPQYEVKLKGSADLGVALPIQGVPVAVGLLGTKDATISVSLKDAFSYGLGSADLTRLVKKWADTEINKVTLAEYEPRYRQIGQRPLFGRDWGLQQNYLRVITKVYLINSVDVTVTDTSSGSAKGTAPLPAIEWDQRGISFPSVKNNLLASTQPTTQRATATQPVTQPSTTRPTPSLPENGARLEVFLRTERTISLKEIFPRPLVLGYLAVDFPIEKHGHVGSPIFTLKRLQTSDTSAVTGTVWDWANRNPNALEELSDWMSKEENKTWMKNHCAGVDCHGNPLEPRTVLYNLKVVSFLGPFNWPGRPYLMLMQKIIQEVIQRP